jgi:protein-tyrosine phosphatase
MASRLAHLNFRDVGGLASAEGKRLREGILYRGEGPRNFSTNDLAVLASLGIATIVDLRSAGERAEMPHSWHGQDCQWLGLDVNADLRVFGNEGRERLSTGGDTAIAIATMEDTYREIPAALLPHWPVIGEVLRAGALPVLINCTAGKDRTGVAVALLLELAGVSRAVIMADYLRSDVFGANMLREGTVEPGFMASYGFLPSQGQMEALIGVRPEYLHAAWTEIEQTWSGVVAYFEAAGLNRPLQRELRDLLIA